MLKIFYNSDSTENEIINANFAEVELVGPLTEPVQQSTELPQSFIF